MRNGILFDETLAKSLALGVGFDGTKSSEHYPVVFMCDDELQTYLAETNKQLEQLVLIIDEADQVLLPEFSGKVKEQELLAWRDKLLQYGQAAAIYAFTGTVSHIEVQCLQSAFGAEVVYYPMLNQVK